MKKWIYFVVPAIGLVAFLFIYFSHVEEAKKLDAQHQTDLAKQAADDAAKKKDLEDRARADADRLAAQRAAEEAKKVADRVAEQAAEDKKVSDATDKALTEGDQSTKQIAQRETELAALRAAKDKANRELLEISKQLELSRIARRTAELEVQRMTEMIARKASDAAMAKFVPPPAPAK
jgi:preprotein translocase subunit SecF